MLASDLNAQIRDNMSVLRAGGLGNAPNITSSAGGITITPASGALGIGGAPVATAQVLITGVYSPTGQGRGVFITSTLHTEAGGAMLGLGVYPTITVADGVATTSINALEIRPTYTGAPSLLDYATGLSVVDYVAPTNTTEASTVRIDNEPTGAVTNWALLVNDGKVKLGGKRGHIIGDGTTDSATQLYLHTTADTTAVRGFYVDPNLAGVTNGNVAVAMLVAGTLKEPPSGSADGYGLRVEAPIITAAAGAFGTLASLYVVAAPTAATINYAIYSGGGNNYFAGNIGAGATNPAYPLDVTGAMRVTTSAYIATGSGRLLIGETSPTFAAFGNAIEVSGAAPGITLSSTAANGGGWTWASTVRSASHTLELWDETSTAYRLIVDANGYLGLSTTSPHALLSLGGGAARGTTEGTNRFDIYDGTAPVGTLANGISLYSTAGELRVMDAAGNATLLSPHDHETNEWIYYSVNTVTGAVLRIDMERLVDAVERVTGESFTQRWTEPPAGDHLSAKPEREQLDRRDYNETPVQ